MRILHLALLGSLALSPRLAAATTINFDNLSAPCLFSSTSPLTTQYSGSGVTFSGNWAVLDQCGNFGFNAHTSPAFLAFNNGTYASGSETLTFSQPASAISFLAGSGGTWTITAYAYSTDALIGSTSVSGGSPMVLVSLSYSNVGRLTVAHSAATGAMDTLIYTLTASNTPPIAEANGPYTVNQGVALTMNSAGSSDPGGAITLYEWDCTANGSYDVSNSSGTGLTCTYPDDGTYTARLRVTDTGGLQATDTATVTVTNTAPVAEANGPYSVNQGVALTMVKTGSSDSDGTLTLYEWDCTNNGSYDTSNSTGLGLTCTYPDDGVYTARLRVTDDDGATATDTATVNVSNTPPLAEANGPYSVNQGVAVTLVKTGSSDSDGTIMLYEWDCTDNGSYDTSSASGIGLTCTYPDDGTFTVRLRVTDDDGGTGTDTATVTVTNTPPVAEANGPYTVNQGVALTMVSTGSSDADGVLVTYEWDCTDNGSYDVSNSTGNALTCTYPDDGTYTARLRVTDDDGGTATDTATVTVTNTSPSAEANGPYTGSSNVAIPLTAVGSSDPDGTLALFEWDCTDNGSYDVSAATPSGSSCTYPSPGSFVVRLRVTDDDGATATDTATVTTSNVPPIAEANGPYSGTEGAAVAVSGVGSSDPNGTITSYSWDCQNDGVYEFTSALPTGHSCTYGDEGSYIVGLRVTDNNGATATDIAIVVVSNSNPVFSSYTPPASAVEGSPAAFSTLATDPGASDVLTYAWNFGDGTGTTNGASVTHTYVDDGVYTITRTVTDGDGGSASAIASFAVSNADPSILTITVPGGNEAAVLAFSATASDPGVLDVLSYAWDFGDGGTATGATPSHAYADDGSYTVTLTVTDGDGGSATMTGTAVIANLPPVITGTSGPVTGEEGSLLSFSASGTDPSALDPLTWSWNWGDGGVGTGSPASHAWGAEGTYPITVTVQDGDGGSATTTFLVTITNVAPTVTALVAPGGAEGQTLSFSASATDPGVGDVITFTWDFGDGGTATGAAVTHAYIDDGNYLVTVTVTDDELAATSSSAAVAITNVAPVWQSLAGPNLPIDEGTPYTWDGSATDVGAADVLSFSWDFGDGSAAALGDPVTHAFPDQGAYSAVVTVDDGDGGSVTNSFAVTVQNVAPIITNSPPTNALEATTYVYAANAFDPAGPADPLTWTLSGSAPTGMTVNASTGVVTWTPTYQQALLGTASATLSVDDGDGGADAVSWTITVFTGDNDGDGIPDSWEDDNGLDPSDPSDAALDPDGDGMSNFDEWAQGTDPFAYDGPTVPVLLEPIGGVEVASSSPELVLLNASDPQGDLLTYDYEVYADAALTMLVDAVTGIAEDASGETTWKVTVPLAENGTFYWRARAWDDWGASAWASEEMFVVDEVQEPPAVPVLVYPVAAEWAPLQPTLLWGLSADPDGDAVSYDVEVWDESMTTLVTSATDVPGAAADATWTLDVLLQEDAAYVWTARAVDGGGLASDWAIPEMFLATGKNAAPVGVEILSPADGSTIAAPDPDIVASAGFDPEGELLTYTFEVDTVASFDGADYASAVVPGGTVPVIWSLSAEGLLLPEDAWVYARVQAHDPEGVASVPDTVRFFVRGDNDAPPTPVLLRPEDGVEAEVPTVLVVETPVDPEADPVFVEFVVATDDALGEVVALSSTVLGDTGAAPGETGWTVAATLPAGTYYWSARGSDDGGATSAWALPFRFTVGGGDVGDDDDSTPEPEPGEGCQCGKSDGDGEAALLALLAAPWLGRRRRRA